MKVENKFKYHFLLGLIIVFMDIFGNYIYLGSDRFLNSINLRGVLLKITFFITFFSIYAIQYNIVCPKTLSKTNKKYFFLITFLMLFVFAALRYVLDEVIIYSIFGSHNYYDNTRVFGYYVFDNSYYAMKALLFSTIMYLFFMYVRNKDEAHTIEIEYKEKAFNNQLRRLLAHVKDETIEQSIMTQVNKKLTIKVGRTVSFVPRETIKYILASGSYVDVKTIKKSYTLRTSLDNVLKEIDDKNFVRIHRSTIINIDFIDKLIYSDHGEVDAKMKDETLFRISNSYKKEFFKLIDI